MTPKEKAKELVGKFRKLAKISGGTGDSIPASKQCALIAVDEITSLTVLYDPRREEMPLNLYPDETKEYWENVKSEIEKL
jgi:ferritin-like protein